MVYIRLTKSSGQFDEAGVSMNEWREIPPARDAVGAELARLTAEITTLRARLETVEAAGRELANCAYNISQRGEMSERERVFLREAQCNWDSAIRNLEPRHD